MANPERRQELERQKAIIQQHLAWLDREIAQTESDTPEDGHPPPSPSLHVAGELLPEGIETERRTAADIQQELRSGCFFYCALLVLASLVFYGILHFIFVTNAPVEDDEETPDSPPFSSNGPAD
ncbi:MAG: hypothetical protein JJT75_06590 [Opitutales bacterium]|nr:hypothetical protein [Opitutales bacterium]MCH8540789.1 hypothetical protein [Opitutales bacterium]